jgi:hypothetical protein
MKFKVLFALCLAVLASCSVRAADGPGTGDENAKKNDLIGGVYHSDTKKPLGNVTVTAINGGKKEQTVLTDASGAFYFNDLKPGAYKLVFEKDGFRKVIKEKNINRVDESLGLTIQMEEHAAYDFTPGPSHFFDFDK